MKVERIMTILMSENSVNGHAKLITIGGSSTLYIDVRNLCFEKLKGLVRIGDRIEEFAYNRGNRYYPLSIDVSKATYFDVLLLRENTNSIVVYSNNLTSRAREEMLNNLSNSGNGDTYTRDIRINMSPFEKNNEVNTQDDMPKFAIDEHTSNENVLLNDDAESNANIFENTDSEGDDNKSDLSDDKGEDEPNNASDIIDDNDVYTAKVPFYASIKGQFDELFRSYERETVLEKLVVGSEFVRIYYDDNNYYVVGIIRDDAGIPEVICYGYPGEGGVTPPVEVEESYEWLPLDKKNSEGVGYYMMYQNAVNGDILEN